MTMLKGRLRQHLLLPGMGACVMLLCSTVSQAGINGGDIMVRMAGINGGDLDVLGVVEGTESASAGIVVSGQTVHLTTNTKFTAESGASLAPGALVAVYGTINSDGTVSASEVNVLARPYVAGSTTLYVRGLVKSTNGALATAKVGNLSVDFSSSLYSGSSITAGSVAEFSGLQTSSSTLYASKSGTVQALGINGGDRKVQALGINGGDRKVQALGINGGDLKVQALGINGGDRKVQALGINGGDRKAQALGINGGDRQAQALGINSAVLTVRALGINGGDKR